MSVRRRQKQAEATKTELTPEQLEQAAKTFAEVQANAQQRAKACQDEINASLVEISKKYNCQVSFVPGQVQMVINPN